MAKHNDTKDNGRHSPRVAISPTEDGLVEVTLVAGSTIVAISMQPGSAIAFAHKVTLSALMIEAQRALEEGKEDADATKEGE